MALDISVQLAPNVTAPDANYPLGSSKNETAPGALDGTPYNKTRADDIFGFQQALLLSSALVASGTADTAIASQYMQAIVELASGRAQRYPETGVANAYVLSLTAGRQAPASLFRGLFVTFSPDFTNTGASTLDFLTFGVKDLVLPGGVALAGGELVAGVYVTAMYDVTPGEWVLQRENQATTILRGIVELATDVETQAGTDATRAVTPAGLASLTATDTRAGLIELATLAEIAAASDLFKAVTPGRLSSYPGVSKAWVNFDGTGVVSINDDYNVASITDNSTGDYTVNFSSALANADYAVSGTGTSTSFTTVDTIIALRSTATGGSVTTKTTGAVRLIVAGFTTVADCSNMNIVIN